MLQLLKHSVFSYIFSDVVTDGQIENPPYNFWNRVFVDIIINWFD